MNHANAERGVPCTQDLQYESCCIIIGSEVLSKQPGLPGPSWLRDLLMSSPELVQRARMRPMKNLLKSKITQLEIHGKRNIFEDCVVEAQLQKFVASSMEKGITVGITELQLEASRITSSMELSSPKPLATLTNFFNELIFASTQWLLPFCKRVHLRLGESVTGLGSISRAPELGTFATNAPQPTPKVHEVNLNKAREVHQNLTAPISNAPPYFQDDSNCYRRLTKELSRYVSTALSPRNPAKHVPTDEELQYQARWIMFDEYVMSFSV